MSTTLVKYSYDATGVSPDNLVVNESHTISASTSRAFALNYGPFYGASVVITKVSDGSTLTRNVDYKLGFLQVSATEDTGMEVCACVIILDDTLTGELLATYQVVGGKYSSYQEAIELAIALLEGDTRQIEWANIKNKPEEFAPAAHWHSVYDLYGMGDQIDMLEQIRQAILTGDTASHLVINTRINNLRSDMEAAIADVEATVAAQDTTIAAATAQANTALQAAQTAQSNLTSHLSATNPHGITATMLNLGNVANYGMSTVAAAELGTETTSYMNPLTTAAAIAAKAVPLTRTVNGKALSSNITLTYSDVSAVPATRTVNGKALSSDITLTYSDVSAVPTTRTINSKALSSDITLTASDLGITITSLGGVPTTRTVNGYALSSNITLTYTDVGAVPTSRTINSKALSSNITLTASDLGITITSLGGVPTTRTINGYDLSANRTLTYADVGAVPTSRTVNGLALTGNITLTAAILGITTTSLGAVPTSRTINGTAMTGNLTILVPYTSITRITSPTVISAGAAYASGDSFTNTVAPAATSAVTAILNYHVWTDSESLVYVNISNTTATSVSASNCPIVVRNKDSGSEKWHASGQLLVPGSGTYYVKWTSTDTDANVYVAVSVAGYIATTSNNTSASVSLA